MAAETLKTSPDFAPAPRAGDLPAPDIGRLRAVDAEPRRIEATMNGKAKRGGDAALRPLLAQALGLPPDDAGTLRYLGRVENVESALIARLYDLKGLGPMPSRSALRFALAQAILRSRFGEFVPLIEAASPRNYRASSLVAALIVGLSASGARTLQEAETHMAFNALGMKPGPRSGLAAAILGAAAARKPEREPARPPAAPRPDAKDFAALVRKLAKTMETKPYSGRVAIAQVYDAGVTQGFAFGSLEDFKRRLAEASREGLVDLERQDVAGAMDASLRERSRTAFGRDERHFIVNRWS